MDLFGRKRIAELEKANANLQRRLAQWEDDWSGWNKNLGVVSSHRDALIKTLRDQDQLIWTMGQQPNWERQRPIFQQLQAGTDKRMRLESDRIRDVLIPEVRKAYTERPSEPQTINTKRISHESS